MRITRRLEFDAGHRIPHHDSRCCHVHGHRYAIEITLSGEMIAADGAAQDGMVMDFSKVKAIAQRHVVDQWDHAFLACRSDTALLAFLDSMPGHRTVIFDRPPTAEVLAASAFHILDAQYHGEYGNDLRLEQVRVYETPNCWADAIRGQV